MSGIRRTLVAALTVLGLATFGMAQASAQSRNETPRATEIGITAREIRIAVIADVDNPFAPGLFQGAVNGVRGAARYLNSKAGGGGLAGRKVVVDFIDSHLNPNQTRNAVITACQEDFAMVGTFVLFLSNVDDEVNCKDQAGAVTGVPDLASVATGVPESCSPVAFPVAPAQLVCSTKDEQEQTYNANQGDFKYLLRHHGNDLHGALISSNDTKDANRGGEVLLNAAIQAGIKADQHTTRSGRDPQTAFTPIINQMKSDGSNYSLMVLAADNSIQLRSEAKLQGLTDPDIVWECTVACYDKAVLARADVMEGEYMPMNFVPFEEASTNKTVANFLKYVGKDKADGFAVFGWTATLAFAQAVNAVVEQHGVNGLTRANFLKTGIDALTAFNAGAMIGTVNIKDKVPTPCFSLEQVKKGKFTRVHPKKAGTFDCKRSNRVTVKADLIG